MKQKTQTTALLGLCTAAAMILSYVESFIPSITPGLKIGLPNVVIVFVLYRLGWPAAAAVSCPCGPDFHFIWQCDELGLRFCRSSA